MKHRENAWRSMLAGLLLTIVPISALGQKDVVTVRYLRAAITSIRDRSSVTVRGEYLSVEGLKHVTGRYMRGKPYSRFSAADPTSGQVFTSLYCEHGSEAFTALLETTGRKVFDLQGETGRGEQGEDAILVKRVKLVEDLEVSKEKTAKEEGGRFRITLTAKATGKQTVLVNVMEGELYPVDGYIVVVERE